MATLRLTVLVCQLIRYIIETMTTGAKVHNKDLGTTREQVGRIEVQLELAFHLIILDAA